jgi:hypothetical protein
MLYDLSDRPFAKRGVFDKWRGETSKALDVGGARRTFLGWG